VAVELIGNGEEMEIRGRKDAVMKQKKMIKAIDLVDDIAIDLDMNTTLKVAAHDLGLYRQ
jgi:hypothetical protein